ncbi:phosphonoacetaldehyde hydrolase domain protein, partial [Vibrio cholerae HC-02C1]
KALILRLALPRLASRWDWANGNTFKL